MPERFNNSDQYVGEELRLGHKDRKLGIYRLLAVFDYLLSMGLRRNGHVGTETAPTVDLVLVETETDTSSACLLASCVPTQLELIVVLVYSY
jgi:hypothetical protein